MKSVLFVADFWKDELDGGAESNDFNLLEYLSNYCELRGCNTFNLSEDIINASDFLIISNFVYLADDLKQYIQDQKPYIVYEHDHKYVLNRDPSIYVDYLIPEDQIVNKDFYINAKKVFVLSKICKEVLEKNIPEANVHSIGCSLWSEDTFDYIESLLKEKKINDLCLVRSENPIKNYGKCLEYCKKQDIIPFELSDPNYKSFLKKMASCKRFLFMPGVLETFSRVSAEAKMLDLDLLTMPKKLGFGSEEQIFHLRGLELIDALRARNNKALKEFGKELGLE